MFHYCMFIFTEFDVKKGKKIFNDTNTDECKHFMMLELCVMRKIQLPIRMDRVKTAAFYFLFYPYYNRTKIYHCHHPFLHFQKKKNHNLLLLPFYLPRFQFLFIPRSFLSVIQAFMDFFILKMVKLLLIIKQQKFERGRVNYPFL